MGNYFHPPPPTQFTPHEVGPNAARNPNPPSRAPPAPYGVTQAQNGYQQPHQPQHQQPLQSQSQQNLPSSLSPNNTSFANYPPITNPPQIPYSQSQSQPGMQQQSTSTIIPSNGSANPPVRQIEDAWKEYTAPGGVKYYYNEILKESTYTMPEALKKKNSPSLPSRIFWYGKFC